MSQRERPIGSHDYAAYVGPPEQYDFMGATQFRLLCALGLRAGHRLLDFGCGSLRAGRLLISYLDSDCYFGIEPNQWLVDEGLQRHVGDHLAGNKRPRFDHNDRFDAGVFKTRFDYIVAQSIFSHTGVELTRAALLSFADNLSQRGRVLCTFVESRDTPPLQGWHYPQCVSYPSPLIHQLAGDCGLHAQRLPWYHPRQTWYLMTRDKQLLVADGKLALLNGAVLFEPQFRRSHDRAAAQRSAAVRALKRCIPRSWRAAARRWRKSR